MLRNTFIDLTEKYGDDFRNSSIVIRQGVSDNKLIYKGKAINIPKELLDRKILIISNENNKTCYIID